MSFNKEIEKNHFVCHLVDSLRESFLNLKILSNYTMI